MKTKVVHRNATDRIHERLIGIVNVKPTHKYSKKKEQKRRKKKPSRYGENENRFTFGFAYFMFAIFFLPYIEWVCLVRRSVVFSV